MMTPAEIDAFSVDLDRFLDLPPLPRVKHNGPFSKRPEGRARRTERRQVRARKMDWINS
ncbi:MAG TPA: hypothetical protein VGA34_13450 [Alteraurantiacibacter sp.]